MKTRRKQDNAILYDYMKYLNQFRNKKIVNIDELYALYKESSGNDKINIRNQIVEQNLPLIVNYLIQRYNYSYDINPVYDLDDIIQTANLLLIKAIDKYTPERGSFSNFIYVVLHNVYYQNSIPNSPVNFKCTKTSEYRRIKKYIDLEYEDEYISKCCNNSIQDIQALRSLLTDTVSYDVLLEKIIDKENCECNNDFSYEDKHFGRILEEENINIRNKVILESLAKLTDKQKNFIIVKFGLDGLGQRKNSQAAREIGCHEKYGQEIYKRSLARMLKNENLKEVYDLVDIDYDYAKESKTYYLKK